MPASLQLHSERFSANGNLVAEGIEKLLGAPSLDLLTVLVREATQNVCDATLKQGECRLKWRLRRLNAEEIIIFRDKIFSTLPEEASARQGIENFLLQPEWQWVLEICDYGTTGLQGPTRADRTAGVDNPDFVNFFRNLGAPRDVDQGGGTYGYGKSTLYKASRCHTIIVDTLTRHDEQEERRLMAAQLGRSVQGRFTGRHWWGVPIGDGSDGVDPLKGPEAAELVEAIGLPSRNAGQTGTSIMILAPVFTDFMGEADNEVRKELERFPVEELITGAIRENLLWFFWPRMLQDAPPGKRLVCETWNGQAFEQLEHPENLAPFHLFARALKLARGEGEPENESDVVHDISSQRPIRFLGRLALARGKRRHRKLFLPPLQPEILEKIGLPSRIPEHCHHVALMRPAEIVVKYEKGEPDADSTREWAGAFRVSDEEEVERAFADAEPPAHDDWRPDILSERRRKTFVRVALRRIREKLAPTEMEPAWEGSDTHPLGQLADELGRFLDLENAPGPVPPRPSPGGGGRRKPFTQPRFAGLMEIDGRAMACFAFMVNADISVAADLRVMVDGKADAPDEIVGQPEILEWLSEDGTQHRRGEQVDLTPGKWEVRVVMPDQAAVKIRLREAE